MSAENKVSDFITSLFRGVRSDHLKHFRFALEEWHELQPLLGDVARFRVVVDTNVVLGDLLWLCKKRKNEEAKTSLLEVIEAETIEAYAPPALIKEVEEKLPYVSKKRKVDIEKLQAQWETYKTKLTIQEPEPASVKSLQQGVDPDDAFFISLAEDISAHGVVSKDHHIGMMGGNWITVECVTSLRNYSRAISVNMSIKVSGVALTGVAIESIRHVVLGIKTLAAAISRAPDWVKIALVAGSLFVALHPGARAKAIQWVKSAITGIKDVTPYIAEHIAEAAVLSEKHGTEAKVHLEKAMTQLDRNREG